MTRRYLVDSEYRDGRSTLHLVKDVNFGAWIKRFPTKEQAERYAAKLNDYDQPVFRYSVSMYTDGPATRWNVIDRHLGVWVRRFPTKEEAEQYAAKLNGALDHDQPARSGRAVS